MKRSVKDASNLGLYVIIGVALFLMINYLGIRHYARWDLTKNKVYSLTDQTKNVLKEVKKDVTLHVLFQPTTPLYDNLKELFKRYRAASERIKVEILDPDKQPLRVQELAKKFGISRMNVIVVTSGEKKKFLYDSDLAEMDYSGMQMGRPPSIKAFKGEEAITSAILNVTQAKQMTIGFMTGHGEKGVDDFDQTGLSQLKSLLEKENYAVKTMTTLGKEKVDDGLDVLCIAGPRAPFLDQERKVLSDYLDNGGRLLLFADPVFSHTGYSFVSTGLEPLLIAWGVKLEDDVVLDRGNAIAFWGPETIYVDTYRSHPITDKMQKVPTIFPLMRSVKSVMTAKKVKTTLLMTASNEGWGETDLRMLLTKNEAKKDAKDIQPPVGLAVAVQTEEKHGEKEGQKEKDQAPETRIVVVGDSDFAANGQIANLGNASFALNAINFLAEQETLISIPSKKPEQAHIQLNHQQMRTIFLLVIILLPLLGIILGVVVWRKRRK